jgi:hypothetical protein
MEPTITKTNEGPQTGGQWAVRWHGLVLFALLTLSVPICHLLWHQVLGQDGPWLRTRSQMAPPLATMATVLDGTWMTQKEKQLREDTPVTWWLRSTWNEWRYRLGVPTSAQVHFGKDEWLFIQDSIAPNRAAFEQAQPARRRFLAEVRDLVRNAGAELFVVVYPDKARVYPELCFGDGVLPPSKRDNYAAILADLAATDIPTVDLAAVLAAERAAHPDVELYYRRDTHWRPQGALAATRAIAAAIEARFGDRLGPRAATRLTGPTAVRLVGDLVANMGIGSVEVSSGVTTGDPILDATLQWRSTPMSFLCERLCEEREYYGLEIDRGGVFVAMDGNDQEAPVLHLGASFAHENGYTGIAAFLGRQVRKHIRFGAVGIDPLRIALPELRAGTKAKVVIWDVVERGFFAAEWSAPRL